MASATPGASSPGKHERSSEITSATGLTRRPMLQRITDAQAVAVGQQLRPLAREGYQHAAATAGGGLSCMRLRSSMINTATSWTGQRASSGEERTPKSKPFNALPRSAGGHIVLVTTASVRSREPELCATHPADCAVTRDEP